MNETTTDMNEIATERLKHVNEYAILCINDEAKATTAMKEVIYPSNDGRIYFVDLDTHGMFICSVTEARVISKAETMTYTYYQKNVKPKPETQGKKGWVCKVCGYVYEGETLPEDFICPLCKHGAADFEPIQ